MQLTYLWITKWSLSKKDFPQHVYGLLPSVCRLQCRLYELLDRNSLPHVLHKYMFLLLLSEIKITKGIKKIK